MEWKWKLVPNILREDYSWGKKWPAKGDEVILMDKTPSWKAFHLMEEFADSISDGKHTFVWPWDDE